MRIPHYTRQFKKDISLSKKRGKDMAALTHVLSLLIQGHDLADKYKDHPLKGPFAGYRECHLNPDWLLIYKLEGHAIIFTRTGTHSDLFG